MSDSKPRMHSFETMLWSSCLRFKRCTMVPNSSCRHLADFDDDTLAKTWLHDVDTTPMKFSERTPNHLSRCPFRPVTPKKVVSGHSLRARSSQEVDRSPAVAIANFRAGIRQSGRRRRACHRAGCAYDSEYDVCVGNLSRVSASLSRIPHQSRWNGPYLERWNTHARFRRSQR